MGQSLNGVAGLPHAAGGLTTPRADACMHAWQRSQQLCAQAAFCINASTCCICPARNALGDYKRADGNLVAAYMAGYMSVAGVPALLARVTDGCLAGASGYGSVQREVWYALVPHLTSPAHLTLRFSGKAAPLPEARLLGMPLSAQSRMRGASGSCAAQSRMRGAPGAPHPRAAHAAGQ